jgi:hypothetical protein
MAKKMVIKYNTNWKEIFWKDIHLNLYNLQYKIYRYTKKNKINLMRKVQKDLVNEFGNKLLAVRMVSQDNRGKVSAGGRWNFELEANRKSLLS